MRRRFLALGASAVIAAAVVSVLLVSGAPPPGQTPSAKPAKQDQPAAEESKQRTSMDVYIAHHAEQPLPPAEMDEEGRPVWRPTPEQYFWMTPLGQEVHEAGQKLKHAQEAREIEAESLTNCVRALITEPLARQIPPVIRSGPPTLSGLLRELSRDLRVARLSTLAKLGDEAQRAELLAEAEAALEALRTNDDPEALRMALYGKSGETGGAAALPLLLADLGPTPAHIAGTVELYERSLDLQNGYTCWDTQEGNFDPEINCVDGARMLLVHGMEQILARLLRDTAQSPSAFSAGELDVLAAYQALLDERRQLARTAAEMLNTSNLLGQSEPVDIENPAELDRVFAEGAQVIHMLTQSEYSETTPGLYGSRVMDLARLYLQHSTP